MTKKAGNRLNRRTVLATAAAGAITMPWIWTGRANAANQLAVRTPGGSFDDIKKEAIYEPFRKATGIEIIPVAATVAKLLAMHNSRQMEVDLIDTGDDVLLQLEAAGALLPIDYKAFKRTDINDIEATVRHKSSVGSFNYAMVMGYHTEAYPKGKEPQSWAEFWDIQKFPGPRMLADMASASPDIEAALIADGVPPDKLFPLDIDRAFKVMTKVRPAISKFWDTGALAAQMLASKEVVLGSIWSTRIGVAISKGAPLGIQWNQNAVLGQAYGIPKAGKNPKAALEFIDYSLSTEAQSAWFKKYAAIPVNEKAYPATARELMDPEKNVPWTKSKGYVRDIEWWAQNRPKVNAAWNRWVAQ